MNVDDIWNAIDEQRVRTADLLEQLTDDEWSRPSLCEGWTVRDVAAHLTLQQLTLGQAIRMALRHPGGVNTMIRASARSRAASSRLAGRLTPAPASTTRRATSGWSRPNGTATTGTPAATDRVTMPNPAWQTTAEATGSTWPCGTCRSTRTLPVDRTEELS